MEKILGIDLGTNSIGWAIRDLNVSDNQIIDKGVLTFDKGVAEDKSGEHPMVQKRTNARGIRRNYQAEKYRKWELLKTLIENNMCPLTMDELNDWRHYTKGVGRKYPQSKKFIQWLRFDFDGDGKTDFERLGFSKHESYYLFRCLIIDETKKEIFKKEPHIIGRILYLLVQRRGYNDGSEIDEKEQDELSKTIKKGGGEAGASGSDEIEPYIEKYKTLGAALYHIQKEQKVRIRKRYNLRSKYEAELKEICRVQNIEHLYKLFWKAIIWQRPLRGQKGLVGICTFEQNKRRCPISHPLYEEYRTWVFINNLKIKCIDEENTDNIKLNEVLTTIVYPEFYKAATDFKLSVIKKKLDKIGYAITAKFPDDTKVNSVQFLYRISEIYGEDWKDQLGWQNLINNKPKDPNCKYNIEDLWHLHFTKTTNSKTGESGFDFLNRFAIEKLSLDEENAKTFSKIKLQQGYATLSANAIKKIVPYLQKGFIYSESIYLANLPQVLGATEISENDVLHFSEEVRRILRADKIQKKYIQTINDLISDQLNAEANTRFGMDPSYQLDTSDLADIENKLISVFGNATWTKLSSEEKQVATNFVSDKYLSFLRKRIYAKDVFEKTERIHDKIFHWISETYSVPEENKKHLWHPSEQETYKKAGLYHEVVLHNKTIFIPINEVNKFIEKNPSCIKGNFITELLGSPEPISKGFKNPMALKTLHKLKKLINYLIETKKIDENTRVVIEIARELNDANKRKAIERWQRDRETENVEFAKAIIGTAKLKYPNLDEKNPEVIHKFRLWFEQTENSAETWKQITGLKDDVKKLRLWQEQKGVCLYTGKSINISELFNGSKYDFEHTIPASMSFDNELKNLTIADKTYNQQIKNKKLPSECPNFDKDILSFSAILPRIEFMRKKVEELETRYERAIYFSKKSITKEDKDKNIQEKNYIKINLDYWRYKLKSFTTTEYKAGWRNSQLRDTQTVTKYALPYLKTVFKKVEVQKGNITSDFRKIFKIQPRLEKKERTKHSHHAIDAAVLTLIPPAAIRDKILEKYNEANECNTGYHETPRQWANFKTAHVLNIENEILINYLPEHRTLTPTVKNVRKRGKIQFVKEKSSDGKWQYKLDDDGKKISLVAKGDSIRGQLHKDSFFGAILKPIYDENDKAINTNGKFSHEEKPSYVKRVHLEINTLQGFKLYKDDKDNAKFLSQFEDIIDPYVKKLVKNSIIDRINIGTLPKDVLLDPIMMLDKNGNNVHAIRRVRVFQGTMNPPEIKKIEEPFLSKHPHKQYIYAENTDYVSMACYIGYNETKSIIYHFKPFTTLGLSKTKKIPLAEYQNGVHFNLLWELKPGLKIIVKKSLNEDVKELENNKIIKRIYKVNTVYPAYQGKYEYFYADIDFNLNTFSAEIKVPKRGKELDFENPKESPQVRLNLSKSTFLIEKRDFIIELDGKIKWLF